MIEAKIEMIKDGPLVAQGIRQFRNSRGEPVAVQEKMYLCRCGASKNKPYCDGSHWDSGFKDGKN